MLPRFILVTFILTVASYFVVTEWAVRSVTVNDINGPASVASLIRKSHVICLVDPASYINDEKDNMGGWIMAEIHARVAIVFLIWWAGVTVTFIWTTRSISTPKVASTNTKYFINSSL